MLDILAAATMLFLIMDPLGNLPIYMSVLKTLEPRRRQLIIFRELIVALVILMLFLHSGQVVLDFLKIDQETVSIAGGMLSNQEPNKMMEWSIALFAAWATSALILSFSSVFHRLLGEKGLNAVERLMGMILVMIAIQMFLNGISAYVNTISI
jgi:multiple antibiotic resistance protein